MKLSKADKAAIATCRASIGPHCAEVLKKMLLELNAELELAKKRADALKAAFEALPE
jgi:hypothetical protein